ncbi:MAG: BrnT family toxin [Bauldia sp.]
MIIVWDEPKRLANLSKHRLDFADIDDFGWADAFITPSHSRRLKAVGLLRGKIVVVVYARLGTEAISIVGMRPANAKERGLYEQNG